MNYQELLHKNVKFKDVLGEHGGVIEEVTHKENGIFAYVLSFGQYVWLNVDDLEKTWWLN